MHVKKVHILQLLLTSVVYELQHSYAYNLQSVNNVKIRYLGLQMNRNSRVYFLKSLLQRLSIFRGRRRHQRLFAVLLDGAVETCPLANYCVAQRLQRIMYCKCNIKLQPGIAANSLTEVGCSDVVVIVCSGERCTEGERRAPAHNGVWGHSPQRGPGSKACCLSS